MSIDSSNHRKTIPCCSEVMLGMCSELFQLRHALILAACWLLSASRGCCFLPLCPRSSCLGSCELKAKNSAAPRALVSVSCMLVSSCLGLGKSLGKGVCFK